MAGAPPVLTLDAPAREQLSGRGTKEAGAAEPDDTEGCPPLPAASIQRGTQATCPAINVNFEDMGVRVHVTAALPCRQSWRMKLGKGAGRGEGSV